MRMKVFDKPYTASSLIVMARKQRPKAKDYFNLKKVDFYSSRSSQC